ncbi:MAG TPA: hypothetical protein ENK23_00110, partial [Sorangium sp.]|nr:hypothetical protein [Sorangium sp.]
MTTPSAPAPHPTVTLDELAAAVVVAVHRLTKQATLYTTENQAQRRQIEETQQAVSEYGRRTGRNPRLFFTERAVFVGGRLLYGGRQTYEAAIELGKTLNDFGVDEMAIGYDVPTDDLRDYQRAVAEALRNNGPSPASHRYQRIRLRRGTPPGRRPGLQDDELPADQQLVRLYATAIVVMRRFLEQVQRGKLRSPVRVRRIAQMLAELGAVQSPAFLGATALYNSRHEHAGRAVNAAMLALGMARQITDDVRLLARIAMAALLYDVGVPRAAGSDPTGAERVGLALPTLGEQQREQLPGATAATITALAGMGDAGITYAVMVYEALNLNHRDHTAGLYDGEHVATLESRIVATARLFTTLLASTDEELSADDAMRRI